MNSSLRNTAFFLTLLSPAVFSTTTLAAPPRTSAYVIDCIDTDGGDNPSEAGGVILLLHRGSPPGLAVGYGENSESVDVPGIGNVSSDQIGTDSVGVGTIEYDLGMGDRKESLYAYGLVPDKAVEAPSSGSTGFSNPQELPQNASPQSMLPSLQLKEFSCKKDRMVPKCTRLLGDNKCYSLLDLAQYFTGKGLLELASMATMDEEEIEQAESEMQEHAAARLEEISSELIAISDHDADSVSSQQVNYTLTVDKISDSKKVTRKIEFVAEQIN